MCIHAYAHTHTHTHTHTHIHVRSHIKQYKRNKDLHDSTYYYRSVQLNQLMLSEGEDKLRRLIQQKKFTEAESYALDNDLDAEVQTFYVGIIM